MSKGMQKLTRFSLAAILLSGISLYSYGQKLKSVQEGSVLAPANIKVDAKLTEWNDVFQAFNKSTDIYYTISNDDKNLYLAIKSTDATNNTKIVGGGISFTINTQGKKKDKDAFVLTYPVVSRANRGQGGGGGRQRGGGGAGGGGARQPLDSAAIAEMRKQALASAKEIHVSGFKAITDSTISIYNEYGIKAAVDYDAKGNFIYELAIPLQLLDISTDAPKEFAYNLKLNGLQIGNRGGANNDGGGGGGGGFGGGGGRGGGGGGFGGGGGRGGGGGGGIRINGGGIDIQSLTAPTDFWGKYTLAKK